LLKKMIYGKIIVITHINSCFSDYFLLMAV